MKFHDIIGLFLYWISCWTVKARCNACHLLVITIFYIFNIQCINYINNLNSVKNWLYYCFILVLTSCQIVRYRIACNRIIIIVYIFSIQRWNYSYLTALKLYYIIALTLCWIAVTLSHQCWNYQYSHVLNVVQTKRLGI